MGSKTAYLEKALLEHALGGTVWTPPGTWYAALSTDAFDDSLLDDGFSEVVAADYARLALSNDTTQFPAASGANPTVLGNGADWSWPVATNDWLTVRSVYLVDLASGGHACYGTDVVGGGVPIGIGGQFIVPIGGFVVRET
jgi:hypothetical protein